MTETEIASATEAPSRVSERLFAISNEEANALRRWWKRLTLSPGALKAYTDAPPWPKGLRATLRRCDASESAMLTEAFRHLWHLLPDSGERSQWKREQRLQVWASIALVVAELRQEHPGVPLGSALGQQKRETRKPCMSELRFQQLMTCRTPEELTQRLRRALALIDNRGVSVVHLADNIALWWRESQGGISPQPTRRLGFIWANDYFGATAGYRNDSE